MSRELDTVLGNNQVIFDSFNIDGACRIAGDREQRVHRWVLVVEQTPQFTPSLGSISPQVGFITSVKDVSVRALRSWNQIGDQGWRRAIGRPQLKALLCRVLFVVQTAAGSSRITDRRFQRIAII